MHGLLVVDKPVGPTSHDIVARARRALGERRVGHTGTLDPAASGVLPLVFGRATRLARFLSARRKTYVARIRLGLATDTYDAEGSPVGEPYQGLLPDRAAIEAALDAFRGTFQQQPPVFSAKKVGGRRSHRVARAAAAASGGGQAPVPPAELAPVTVTTYALDVLALSGADLDLRVTCSAGFYVRSLAHELGVRLGTGAHLAALRRTHVGRLSLEGSLAADDLENRERVAAAFVPLDRMLPELTTARLTHAGAERARRGQDVGPSDLASTQPGSPSDEELEEALEGVWRLVDPADRLVGLARASGRGFLHPFVVLV